MVGVSERETERERKILPAEKKAEAREEPPDKIADAPT